MVKIIIFFFTFTTVFYGCFIHHKSLVNLPEKNFILNPNILKTDGYYYTERTRISYCKNKRVGSGSRPVETSKYEQKGISYLFLFVDGYLYNGGLSMLPGVLSGENYYDHCNLVDSNNNFYNARSHLEHWLKEGTIGKDKGTYKKGLFQRGVYQINEKNIKLQHYAGSEGGPYLLEYIGEILNDTTFVITSRRSYDGWSDYEDWLFKFKKFPIKPDSINYIRNNKHKFGDN